MGWEKWIDTGSDGMDANAAASDKRIMQGNSDPEASPL
jgi:hypothetical protein